MNNIIEIRNLGKKYTITHESRGAYNYTNFRDVITDSAKNLWKKTSGNKTADRQTREEIWALKDINLEIGQGERVGIIGRNGAGKSTLLKILSRITDPTEGCAKMRGRVSSLLEVGTGFHPELTGRENIYLNGAILGMKKVEIDRKFDEIVDFSGVEKFLDTPVKRYSSGMNVRLAFAVAAHLEPEILLIDEVLAVGDAEFQKKCLGKMDEVSKQHGRTILFVSHNLPAIQNLCSRAILLLSGHISANGPVDEVVQKYIAGISQKISGTPLVDRTDRTGGDIFRFTKVEFLDAKTKQPLSVILSGQDVLIRIHYRLLGVSQLDNVLAGIRFFTVDGKYLCGCSSLVLKKHYLLESSQKYITCQIPKWPLTGGEYRFLLVASKQEQILDKITEAGFIEVETGDYYSTGKMHGEYRQSVLINFRWF